MLWYFPKYNLAWNVISVLNSVSLNTLLKCMLNSSYFVLGPLCVIILFLFDFKQYYAKWFINVYYKGNQSTWLISIYIYCWINTHNFHWKVHQDNVLLLANGPFDNNMLFVQVKVAGSAQTGKITCLHEKARISIDSIELWWVCMENNNQFCYLE